MRERFGGLGARRLRKEPNGSEEARATMAAPELCLATPPFASAHRPARIILSWTGPLHKNSKHDCPTPYRAAYAPSPKEHPGPTMDENAILPAEKTWKKNRQPVYLVLCHATRANGLKSAGKSAFSSNFPSPTPRARPYNVSPNIGRRQTGAPVFAPATSLSRTPAIDQSPHAKDPPPLAGDGPSGHRAAGFLRPAVVLCRSAWYARFERVARRRRRPGSLRPACRRRPCRRPRCRPGGWRRGCRP